MNRKSLKTHQKLKNKAKKDEKVKNGS